jgi:hypothetical protein
MHLYFWIKIVVFFLQKKSTSKLVKIQQLASYIRILAHKTQAVYLFFEKTKENEILNAPFVSNYQCHHYLSSCSVDGFCG